MTDKEYYVRGCTALLDAVGGAIHHIGNVHKYAREEDRPEKTIFVITTDGLENASREYSYDRVKKMVERQKEKYGWEFLFLGANIDAIETAGRFGISADRAAIYHSDHEGTALNYEVLADTVCKMRASAAPIGASWNRALMRTSGDAEIRETPRTAAGKNRRKDNGSLSYLHIRPACLYCELFSRAGRFLHFCRSA